MTHFTHCHRGHYYNASFSACPYCKPLGAAAAPKVLTIGRLADNDVVIADDLVSRHHCQIVRDERGRFSVVDCGSTNGTYVNSKRIIGNTPLAVGDFIRIGNTLLPWESYFKEAPSGGGYTPPPPPPVSIGGAGVPAEPEKSSTKDSRRPVSQIVFACIFTLFGLGNMVRLAVMPSIEVLWGVEMLVVGIWLFFAKAGSLRRAFAYLLIGLGIVSFLQQPFRDAAETLGALIGLLTIFGIPSYFLLRKPGKSKE